MSRKTKPLSATQVEKSKPKDKLYRLYDGNGLVLNITPNGGKYWYLQYKQPISNKAQMMKLGTYPAMSLTDARSKREELLTILSKGKDPKVHSNALLQSELKRLENDFKSVFEDWFKTRNYAQGTVIKLQTYMSEMNAIIGHKPITEITTQDCIALLKPIEQANHLEKLKKIKTLLNQTFIYAIAMGICDSNPVSNLNGIFKTKPKQHNPAILDEYRLKEMVQGIYGYNGSFVVKKCLLFALYTFARQGSIRQIKRDDIVDGVWKYTPSKTKHSTGVQMVTPLSKQACEIINQLKQYHNNEFIFSISNKPISENTLNQALRRIGIESSEQTVHGFRAIARTLLEEKFKYDYRIIEMQLEHQVRDSNGRAYNRVTWFDERKDMLQVWADYIDDLIHSSISLSSQ